MNARESLAADRAAEQAWARAEGELDDTATTDAECVVFYLRSIAAELRAARVYANYLEGRDGARVAEKREQRDLAEELRS